MIAQRIRAFHNSAGDLGSAAVEFAMTAPLLIVLALGIADYGMLMTNAASLEGATRAVAEYARDSAACAAGGLSNGSCIAGITNFVSLLTSTDTSLSSATFSLPPSANLAAPQDLSGGGGNYCTCVDGGVVDCSRGTCNVGGDTRVLQYIRVSATQNSSPLFGVINFGYLPATTFLFPALLSAQTTTRIE